MGRTRISLLTALLAGALVASGCTSNGSRKTSAAASKPAPPEGVPAVTATIATGLQAPWGIALLPNGDALVTERDTGGIVLLHGSSTRVVGHVPVASGGEAGLLGIVLSPAFATDRRVFVYATTSTDNRVLRMSFDGNRIGGLTTILTGIPKGTVHDGGRLVFGPDGYLYVGTGETGRPELAQDRRSLAGKILRITADGTPAPGNPSADSPVWTLGHRNVQGLAFDNRGRLWATEFGQNDYDEVNLIQRGRNYGWPVVEGDGGDARFTRPELVWHTSDASPSGLAYIDGQLWMATLRGERLWRIDVAGERASNPTAFLVGDYGRLRTVVATAAGQLWLSTSNTDGRGDPKDGDDRILVLTL